MKKVLQLRQLPFLHNARKPRKSNLQELKLKSGSLFDKRDTINKNLVRELKKGRMPSRECHKWLKKVEEIQDEVYNLLGPELKDSELEVPSSRTRLKTVLNEIAEHLDKSPNKNDIADDAVTGRSKRMKGSKVGGSEYRTLEVGKTKKIRRKAVHSNAGASEPSPGSKETILKNNMQHNRDVEMIYALSTAVSEPVETYRTEHGRVRDEKKISSQTEGLSGSTVVQRGGKPPEKRGLDALRLKKSAISQKLLLNISASSQKLLSPSSTVPLELNEYEAKQEAISLEVAETLPNLESDITSSEIKEMLDKNEIKNSEVKKSIPETQISISEAEGTETIETYKKHQGYDKPEGKISMQQEAKPVSSLDVEAGKNDAKQATTDTSPVLGEKSNTVSSEIKEISPPVEMKNFKMEISTSEPKSSISEPEGITHKSESISSRSGNKRADQISPKSSLNLKRLIQFSKPLKFSWFSSRSETVLQPPKLASPRKHDRNVPEVQEEKTIQCMVQKIIECMQDDKYRRIGIYGKGGIGKTTVLNALLCCPEVKDKFDFLIQVNVSRYWSWKKIQFEVARQIDLSVEGLQSKDEVASKLSHALKSRKFLLLLDDVWDSINLEALGIPYPDPDSHSKIVVATRSVHICKTVAPDRQIEVVTMSWKEAWNLFQEQVGSGIVDSPDIRPRAEAIVSECDGLPLMIIVIGRALAKQNDVLGWRLVLRKLLSVTELNSSDTEDHDESLLQKLKVGYDILHDNDLKYCFLYCALFPENYNIEIPELIKYWIQEGLLTGNPTDAVKKGYRIVRHLTEASLVECWDGFFIKMHDLIRDLASWIMISEENSLEFLVGRKLNEVGNPEQISERRIISNGDRPPKVSRSSAENLLILSRAGAGLARPPEEKEWEGAEMIFLMDNRISALPKNLNCSNLKRLFLQRNMRLTTIPKLFFDSMRCLQVLNLSKTNIRSLPPSLFKLTRLQALILCHCQCLSEISPDIGNLASIEILDLNGTDIYNLPDTIGKLSLLKYLRVSFYAYLDGDKFLKKPENLIPGGLISMLQALEELSITVGPGDTQWNTDADFIAQELCSLSNLKTLYICFPDAKFLKIFIRSSTAWKADSLTKFKFVIGHEVKTSTSCVPKHTELDYHQEEKCLRYVDADDNHIADEVKKVLKRATAFYLDHQSMISSLTEFGTDNINQLKFCIVSECPKMVSILDGGIVNDESALPKLSHLSLHYLWKLKNIWNGEIPAGSFNALKVLSVHTCPNLKFVLSWSMLPHLPSLEDLIVEDCATVTEIIKSEMKIEVGAAELPNLKKLELQYLPELVRICNGSYQKIEHKRIQYCPKLELSLPTSSEYAE